MISIDGVQWAYPCDIQRVSEVKPSEISGLLLDRSFFNDVVGTYLKYTISLAVPLNKVDDYGRIYELLTDPAEGHTFVLPYGQSTITLVGRVENVTDVYVRMPNGGVYWKGTKFDVVANHPTKEMSLSQVLTRGRLPLPDVQSVAVGDIYTYTAAGWEKSLYGDGDNTAY